MFYLVMIYIQPGKLETLRQYEQHAAPIMAKHGGSFERVFRPHPVIGTDTPDEIHLLHFDREDGFAAFRADPELAQFKGLREESVLRATVLSLQDYPLVDYFGE